MCSIASRGVSCPDIPTRRRCSRRGRRRAATLKANELALVLLAGCGSSAAPAAAPRIAKALGALLAAADHASAPWRCAAADTPPLADEVLANGWRVSGHALQRVGGGLDITI